MRRTILVTGGAGYIGSAVTQVLLEGGDRVVVFDDLSAGKRDKVPDGAELVIGDMTNESAIDALFRSAQFDAVIHCAAKKAVGESEERPEYYFRHNVVGTLNVLTAMATYVVPKLVFSSTAAVYAPRAEAVPFTEDSPVAPASVYGQSKLMSEVLIQEFFRTGKLPAHVILRYFNVAGDAGMGYREDAAQNVFPLIARSIESGDPFQLFGSDYETRDGTGVRDYIHISDLADAHARALNGNASGVFNLGTGAGYTVKELVAAFEAATGKKINVNVAPRRAGDVAAVLADASRVRTELSWSPTRTLEDMVASTVAVYELNRPQNHE